MPTLVVATESTGLESGSLSLAIFVCAKSIRGSVKELLTRSYRE
jgi:hypothetical protein